MHEGISPTYNVNLIGHSIFMNAYDGRLLCYEGLVCSVRVSGVKNEAADYWELEKYSKEAAESRYEHRLGGFGQWIKFIRIAAMF